MRALAIVVVSILAGCGSGHAPVASSEPLPAACPASYADITPSGSCDAAATCPYAEGSCWCGPAPRCSGVQPPDDEPPTPPTWQCTPTPPELRPDGCPGVEQAHGAACSTDGLECTWGDCCITQLTCRAGVWETSGGGCPP